VDQHDNTGGRRNLKFEIRYLKGEGRLGICDRRLAIWDFRLNMVGLDHRELTFLFQGREQRLGDVGGDNEFAARC
jgi:hypothetical protein